MRIGIVHIHSDYSRDGKDPLERLRDFALDRDIAFIGLTDHAEDFAPELFDEYTAHCRALSDERVQLIPGLEYRFAHHRGLHLLALGLRAWIEPATPEEFIEQAPPASTLTIMAHPILASYGAPEAVTDGIDAIEVWNASYNTRFLPDPRAIALLQRIQRTRPAVIGVAGLDQHDASNDRETRVLLERDQGDPLAELKAGRFTNRGRTMRFDAAVSFSPMQLRALTAARWTFDRMERTQERLARALAGR